MENKKPDTGKFINIISAAATNDDGNGPKNVFDGDYSTRWSSDVIGAELTLELEELSSVAYIGVACFKGSERGTKIGVSISEDGENYTNVIEKIETPKKAAMVAVSLGATYKAKFIKIHGYGNTQSAWTSITEIKVYAPQPDGSMPVDPNGPKEIKPKTLEDLPLAVREALAKVEVYYDRVIPWLSHMYDPKTGGFYMTMSGKMDPEMEPAVEMTNWGLSYLSSYTSCFADMPADIREKFIQFFYDRQDPESGLFIDKQGVANAREQARNQDSGLGACRTLGVQPKYPHPSQVQKSENVTQAPLMPAFMESPEKYIEWVSSLSWEAGTWHAGDQTQSSQQYIKMLSEEDRERYLTALFNWIESHQYDDGLWSTQLNFNSVSGVFKVGLIYGMWGKKIPKYDAAIDTIFKCYRTSKTENPFFVRNPLSVLRQMCSYGENVKKKIQDGIVENIDAVVANFGEFLCPDGTFSASKGRSMYSFGGVVGSHQLNEGDIDATLMMLIARAELYFIFEVAPPKLESADFWDWITGKKPLPEIYR